MKFVTKSYHWTICWKVYENSLPGLQVLVSLWFLCPEFTGFMHSQCEEVGSALLFLMKWQRGPQMSWYPHQWFWIWRLLLTQLDASDECISWNNLCGFKGKIEAVNLLWYTPIRDAISWNSKIALYFMVKHFCGSLNFFDEMQIVEVVATEVTLNSVFCDCRNRCIGDWQDSVSLKVNQHKFEGYFGNALVDMYVKCGVSSAAAF